MTTYVLNQNKVLARTTATRIYEDENLAGAITFLVPRELGGIDLTACSCTLALTYPSGKSDDHLLVPREESLYEDYLTFVYRLTARDTANDGYITLWLEFYNGNQRVVLKTDPANCRVLDHPSGDDVFSDEQLSVLPEWQLRIDSIRQEVEASRELAATAASTASEAASKADAAAAVATEASEKVDAAVEATTTHADTALKAAQEATEAAERLTKMIEDLPTGTPVKWDDVLDKPATFPPADHTHDDMQQSGVWELVLDGGSASLQ